MKICVCAKQIRHTYAQSGKDPDLFFLNPRDTIDCINPYDEAALQMALRLKEKIEGVQVFILTLGPVTARRELERCLALGADGLYLVEMGGKQAATQLDSWAKASLLARAVQTIGSDLVLCGSQSLDGRNGLVGACMARCLELPFVSAVMKFHIDEKNNQTTVTKNAGQGRREIVACDLPAVFSVDVQPKVPGLPSYKKIQAARARAFERIICDGADVTPRVRRVRRFAPRPRAKQVPAPDSTMEAYERIQVLLQGSRIEKKGRVITGSPASQVDEIVAFIKKAIF